MDKIQIGWREYDIETISPNEQLITGGEICFGEIDHLKQIITLNVKNTEEQNNATLIHEILHGISDIYSLDLNEDMVTRLADAIYTTLKINNLTIEGVRK